MAEQYQWTNDPNAHSDIFPEHYVRYASFGERLVASMIDSLLIGITVSVLTFMLGFNEINWSSTFFGQRFNLEGMVLSLVIRWLYYAAQESSPRQATIGKRALNMHVSTLDGERITFAQASGRFFGKYLSTVILLIGYFMMLWDDKNQTLHDKLAGTLVVKN